MTPIRFNRGLNVHDNRPRCCEVIDFASFIEALDADRAEKKDGAPYFCGPLNGDDRRCAEGALPRRWLALDLDQIAAEILPDLRMWIAGRFSGCAWPTHSSTPEAPRERVIIELDRDTDRAECIRVGDALARDLGEEFGDAIVLDPSTFRGEQPVFVPPTDITLARFFGDPLPVDDYLAAADATRDGGSAKPAGEKVSEAEAIERIRRGEALHETLAALIARWAAKGMSREAIDAAARGLLELARPVRGARVDEFASNELRRLIDGAFVKYAPGSAADRRPVDIFRSVATPALDAGAFPDVLRDLAITHAAAAGHDPSAYLMAMLAATAGAISDQVRLALDTCTGWFESARLWVLLVGAPGTAKTPAIREAMGPLFTLHRELRDEHARKCAALAKDDPKPPAPGTYANDATIEALSEKLAGNPRGLICVFEELDTWIGSHDCYRGGQGSKDRGEWLRLYDGGPHQVDRIRRGSCFVENWGVSILGATTPAGLKRHAGSLPPDGLIQRFLPVFVRPMCEPDRQVGSDRVRTARSVFEGRLRALHGMHPGIVRLSPEAAALFSERRARLRTETEAAGALGDALMAHLAKHAGMLGRIALTFHCLELGAASIEVALSGETVTRAIDLLRRLARHALALFDMLAGERGATELARAVARTILADELPSLTRNDLLQRCKAFRGATSEEREAALLLLVDADWLTPDMGSRAYAGRAATFVVNPEVFGRFGAEGEALRSRRKAMREVFRV